MLFENHYMNIKQIDLFFNPDTTHKNSFVETVLTRFIQKLNIMITLNFVKQTKQ